MARPFDHLRPSLSRLGPSPMQARREILLIHGAWGGAWVWQDLASALAAQGYGVSCLEQPGHGADRWSLPSLTSIDDYADISRRAAASLGRPVLVGHSLGGWQVQKIWEAVDLPGVLLVPLPGAGLPWMSLVKLFLHHPAQMARPLLGRPLSLNDPAMLRRFLFHRLDGATLAEYMSRQSPEPAWVCLQMAMLLGLGLGRPQPRPGREPRLLVAAERDYLVPPPVQQKLARRLGARYVELAGLPHGMWLEDPQDRVMTLLLEFLGDL